MKVKIPVPEPLKILSAQFSKPLYLVGGYVRDYLLYGACALDVDFCACISPKEIENAWLSLGFKVLAVYKKTGTVKLKFNNEEFEYTAFRTEEYKNGGFHTPIKVTFTNDMYLDATRRDFKCNAIYYDIKNQRVVDLLGGISDLENKRLSTVISPEKVFSCDGLRLLRLARFCAKHDLEPKKDVLLASKKHKNLILDVAPDRIKEELNKILSENPSICKKGLDILVKTGVLGVIFDKSSAIKEEKTFAKIVSSLPVKLRFLALSFLYSKDAQLAIKKLEFLKLSKVQIKEFFHVLNLLREFFNGAKTQKEITQIVLDNFYSFSDFYAVAFSMLKETKNNERLLLRLKKWRFIKDAISNKNLPITTSDLKISGGELIELGIEPKLVKITLIALLRACQKNPKLNDKNKLFNLAKNLKP